jgi:CheY-like chemotaxis protein
MVDTVAAFSTSDKGCLGSEPSKWAECLNRGNRCAVLLSREMREGTPRVIGVTGSGPELTAACRSSLRDIATIHEVSLDVETGRLIETPSLDLLLYRLMPPFDPALRLLARCRSAAPELPLVIIGSSVPPDLAVELIKSGIEDFISLPIEHVGLHRKVLRALGEYDGPAFSWSMLQHLYRREKAWTGRNRRHCYRVEITPERSAKARVCVDDVAFELEVLNLSIATEGWPGGILLNADAEIAEELPLDQWKEGGELELMLSLSDDEQPLELIGQTVAGIRTAPSGDVALALQYWTRRPNDEPRIRRFWAEAQRPSKQPPGIQGERPSRSSRTSRPSRFGRRA